jgi:hypothetical protein
VSADDIADAIVSVLAHRVELKPSVKYLKTTEEFIRDEYARFVQEHGELERGGDL